MCIIAIKKKSQGINYLCQLLRAFVNWEERARLQQKESQEAQVGTVGRPRQEKWGTVPYTILHSFLFTGHFFYCPPFFSH